MFKLNSDPEFLHHYIIGVVKNEEDKKMFLKYGPIYYSHENIENIKKALTLRDDKIYTNIYKMSATEIYNMFHCSALVMSLISFKVLYQEKLATVHYFPYKDEISDPKDFFTTYVKRANKYELEREGLRNSKLEV
jgi:hypothetical protein